MSRIGNEHIILPAGVTVEIKDNKINVKGPKGSLVQEYDPIITPHVEGNVVPSPRRAKKETRNTVYTARLPLIW